MQIVIKIYSFLLFILHEDNLSVAVYAREGGLYVKIVNMKSFKMLLALFSIFILERGNASQTDAEDIIKRAQEDIDNVLRQRMKLGARSKPSVHKKVTPM